MMLDFRGEKAAAGLVDAAVRGVLAEGRVLTPDLGGTARTSEVTEAVGPRDLDDDSPDEQAPGIGLEAARQPD